MQKYIKYMLGMMVLPNTSKTFFCTLYTYIVQSDELFFIQGKFSRELLMILLIRGQKNEV